MHPGIQQGKWESRRLQWCVCTVDIPEHSSEKLQTVERYTAHETDEVTKRFYIKSVLPCKLFCSLQSLVCRKLWAQMTRSLLSILAFSEICG